MQLVVDGPDLPERLLQGNEDGRVVFFCGAGVSKPAGLPLFDELVAKLYKNLHQAPNQAECTAIRRQQFETAIGLLEGRIEGGRERVRREVNNILTPELTTPCATATHQALLELGNNRDGDTRLVTTNFDRLFQKVIEDRKLRVQHTSAPSLPVPTNRWAGLVYLHGLLPAFVAPMDLEHLVLSGGDFGRAYMTEGWAARFVTELFRNYTICFVGYGLGDPVLRYMMEALAADRAFEDSAREVFALGGYSESDREEVEQYWKARKLTPILYPSGKHHSKLHQTLHRWAEIYTAGVAGKERIVVEYAHLRPHESTKQDDFVGRLIWALSDRSGMPAKKFARLDPVPSLEWLEPLSRKRFRHADLGRFGVAPNYKMDEKLAFSVIRRPSPYTHSQWMDLMPFGRANGNWDKVMEYLAEWLTRHLDDPHLVRWIVEHGQRLHDGLVDRIRRRLTELGELRRKGENEKLERIRKSAPNAVPRSEMRRIWRILASTRLKQRNGPDLRNWWAQYKCDGLTGILGIELRNLLSPVVSIARSRPWPDLKESPVDADGKVEVWSVLRWDLKLASDYVRDFLPELQQDEDWQSLLPELLPTFVSLLRDSMDLMRDVDGASEKQDYSHWYLPSIEDHDQNRSSSNWTVLIELTRDSWLKVADSDARQARQFAASWYSQPYPVFKRLCFFAATKEDVISQRQSINWLVADKARWLWSEPTRREVIRLLVALAPKLSSRHQGVVERAILAGPPQQASSDNLEQADLEYDAEREVWIRLSKLEAAGLKLGEHARVRLKEIRSRHPDWQMREGDRDEFRTWSSTWSSEDVDRLPLVRLPRELNELVARLKRNP